MKEIKQTYLINSPVEKVWDALVNPKVIEKWSGVPAKMDDKAGTKFELWGGDMHGTNTKIVKNKLLEQDWYGGDWDKPSKVRFELSAKNNQTEVTLTHSGVPEEEVNDFADGWKRYYLGEIKKLLEK